MTFAQIKKFFKRRISHGIRHRIRSWLGIDGISVELHETRYKLFKLEDYIYEHKNPQIHQLRQMVRIREDKRLNKEFK